MMEQFRAHFGMQTDRYIYFITLIKVETLLIIISYILDIYKKAMKTEYHSQRIKLTHVIV